MNANTSLQATDPQRDASVHASAGTGKTWLLVTRVVRLLLAGASIDSILAVTFTRKAAAEMEQRIMQRLRELACSDEEELTVLLEAAAIAPDPDTRQRVRQLYETVLCNPRRLRCTTFHAFCQDLLQRFPLEADVPPGFEVSEKTGQLEQAAYDALLAGSAGTPDDPLTRALDRLTTYCDSLDSAKKSLRSFLDRRSDWWAWTEGVDDPVSFATDRLRAFLEIDPASDPLAGYPSEDQSARHREFVKLLRNNTASDIKLTVHIDDAFEQQLQGQAFLESIKQAYLTRDGNPRARKHSAAQEKRLHAHGGEARFLELHELGCEEVLDRLDMLARHSSLALNSAWYHAGYVLLGHYQRIKRERRVFDFADLEWHACQLLNRSEHAGWVQYKLDARIDHLLIDEFQDTNPTQWRLLRPLLDELAAGDSGRERSVFLVGDRKQSIYSFRRANPLLLEIASGWLEQHRAAERFPLNLSRRSAMAIMECVNRLFTLPEMDGLLPDFEAHDTHLPDVYGRVELLPLCVADDDEADTPAQSGSMLRNPLHEPRSTGTDAAFHAEGRLIAATIQRLVSGDATVERDGKVCRIGYGDIIILLRHRTHARFYEQALREAGIPCLGTSRGMLLENLEVRDLVALLNSLVSPYDNLALAQVLRSPLFDLDSEQLLELAADGASHWYARLARLAGADRQPWRSVHDLLEGWRQLAGQLPVHDLLDRIFHEGEIVQRYEAAFPQVLVPRLRASFTRFIELALELDNGRYPSLPRFLDQLARLRASDQDQPDESAPDDSHADRVRMMTVHAAKGLEAPVLFLADAAIVPNDRSAWSGCVDWPVAADRPELIVLAARKDLRDSRTRALIDRQATAARAEDANLLYVALTRARQYLFVSGSARPGAANTGWYGLVETAMSDCEPDENGHPCIVSGSARQAGTETDAPHEPVVIEPGLSGPVTTALRDLPIAPSRQVTAGGYAYADDDGRERGIALHMMLDYLTRETATDHATLLHRIANRLQRDRQDAELGDWWQEARAVVGHPDLAPLFDAQRYRKAFNEVPVQYRSGQRMIYGVIDRLVVTDSAVLVIDYKSHRHADSDAIRHLVEDYRPQLECYATAAARLWPEREVTPCLLFTARHELVRLDALQSDPARP